MRTELHTAAFVCALALSAAAQPVAQPAAQPGTQTGFHVEPDPLLKDIRVRDGYELSVAFPDLKEARFLESDPSGTLYVSRPNRGEILAFRDANADGKLDEPVVFVTGYRTVHGLCYHHDGKDAWLWFAQTGAIHKAKIEQPADPKSPPVAAKTIETIIPEGRLPKGGGHWWRALLVTDDAIYTAIGDSGNINDESATERQKIFRFNLDGSNKSAFASGLRNTEKLRIRPGTADIYGVDHGSDWFGGPIGDKAGRQPVTDFNPPDEFNRYIEGNFYGHPFVTGNKLPRIEFHNKSDIIELADRTTIPDWCFPAHFAANSFTFIDPAINDKTGAFPKDHNADAFVAARGSWNRTKKAGYKVVRILFDPATNRPYGMLTIVDGLNEAKNSAAVRPVDCVQMPDGSIIFSADDPGRLYRLRGAKK